MADDDRRDRGPAPNTSALQSAPFDEDAEQAVLGTIFLDPHVMREIGNVLEANDFYRESHRCIYRAILDLDEQLEPIDLISVASRLRQLDLFKAAGGGSYLSDLSGRAPTAVNARYYAERVKHRAVQRQLIEFARETAHEAHGEVEDVGELVDSVAHRALSLSMSGVRSNVVHLRDALASAVERTQKLSENAARGGLSGVPSGFHALDRKTGGWQAGDLIILAARPGMGKTAFALNMLANAARDSRGPVAGVIFSLEMTKEQLALRMWASASRVSGEKLRTGKLDNRDWQLLYPMVPELQKAPVFIDDTASIPIAQMMRKCRQLSHEHKIGIVMVDYLQLMSSSTANKNASREQQISEISRSLKALAKELEVPVIALSQLNRGVESRADRRPLLSDLRESGAIEQDADVIVFLYREDYYEQMKGKAAGEGGEPAAPSAPMQTGPSMTEVIVAKHRSGPTGKVEVLFHGPFTLFTNLEHDRPPTPDDADAPPPYQVRNDDYDFPAPEANADDFEPFPDDGDEFDPDVPI